MKRLKYVLVILALALALPVLSFPGRETRQEPGRLNIAQEKDLSELMKQKLEHSQKLLEGLVRRDFDKIAKNADALILLSNRAEWMVVKTARYELYSNTFRRSAEDLIQNARAKNLDGAALAYVDLTLACVKCHKYVREVRDARLDQRAPSVWQRYMK